MATHSTAQSRPDNLAHPPHQDLLHRALRQTKRALVLIVGGTVLLIGILLLVLPGPAFIVIPAGLAILAAEFAWARRLIRRARTLPIGRFTPSGSSDPEKNPSTGAAPASS